MEELQVIANKITTFTYRVSLEAEGYYLIPESESYFSQYKGEYLGDDLETARDSLIKFVDFLENFEKRGKIP